MHKRHGTLWEERFKSVLAEDGHATRMIGAYIDLNPVRAGIVADPKDYRWSSYGEAMAGKQRAREGIQRAVRGDEEGQARAPSSQGSAGAGVLSDWRGAVRRYRELLDASLGKGKKPVPEGGADTADGLISEGEALGGLVRQFNDGLVVGLAPFVNQTFQLARDFFGPKRRDGARKMQGIYTELRAMRDLGPTSR